MENHLWKVVLGEKEVHFMTYEKDVKELAEAIKNNGFVEVEHICIEYVGVVYN